MEPGGEAAGVTDIERIAIGRKNKEREDRGAWKWNGAWWEVFLFWGIERIAKSKNKSNGINNDTKYKSYLFWYGCCYSCVSTNVYLKLSVAAWWSTVAYKTHTKYPYYEPVLLQSKIVAWYLHFSEELELEVERVEKPKIYFSRKVYCRREMDMITAFFWRIRDSEGEMVVHIATKMVYELVQF